MRRCARPVGGLTVGGHDKEGTSGPNSGLEYGLFMRHQAPMPCILRHRAPPGHCASPGNWEGRAPGRITGHRNKNYGGGGGRITPPLS